MRLTDLPEASLRNPEPATHSKSASRDGRDADRTSGPVAGTRGAAATLRPRAGHPRPVAPPPEGDTTPSQELARDFTTRCTHVIDDRPTRTLRPRHASATTPRSPSDANESRLHRRAVPEACAAPRRKRCKPASCPRTLAGPSRAAKRETGGRGHRQAGSRTHVDLDGCRRRHVDAHTGKPACTDVAN